MNEIAESPAGSLPAALQIKPAMTGMPSHEKTQPATTPTKMSYASVSRDGHNTVKFDQV